jgi:hypothetical protein
MLYHHVLQQLTNVSEVVTASIIRVRMYAVHTSEMLVSCCNTWWYSTQKTIFIFAAVRILNLAVLNNVHSQYSIIH